MKKPSEFLKLSNIDNMGQVFSWKGLACECRVMTETLVSAEINGALVAFNPEKKIKTKQCKLQSPQFVSCTWVLSGTTEYHGFRLGIHSCSKQNFMLKPFKFPGSLWKFLFEQRRNVHSYITQESSLGVTTHPSQMRHCLDPTADGNKAHSLIQGLLRQGFSTAGPVLSENFFLWAEMSWIVILEWRS